MGDPDRSVEEVRLEIGDALEDLRQGRIDETQLESHLEIILETYRAEVERWARACRGCGEHVDIPRCEKCLGYLLKSERIETEAAALLVDCVDCGTQFKYGMPVCPSCQRASIQSTIDEAVSDGRREMAEEIARILEEDYPHPGPTLAHEIRRRYLKQEDADGA